MNPRSWSAICRSGRKLNSHGQEATMLVLFTLAFSGDFLNTSDDVGKMPCVIHLVQPQGCASDPMCVRVVNERRDLAVAPSIPGFCKQGEVAVQDSAGRMQVILDPASEFPRLKVIPVLAPKGSGQPNVGWMYLPATVVDVSAVAYGGSWSSLEAAPIAPGIHVNVFDDDDTLDVGDHTRLGVCSTQRGVTVVGNKTIEFSSSCSSAILAASNRK